MSLLRNRQTGDLEEVDDVVGAVESGTHERPDTVTFRTSAGREATVSYDKYKEYSSIRPTATVTGRELAEQSGERWNRREHSEGWANHVQAFVGGLVKGTTVGIISPWEEEQSYHPYLSTAGDIVGTVAPIILTAGGAAPEVVAGRGALRSGAAYIAERTPAGLLARAGTGAGRAVEAAIGKGIVSRTAGAAAAGFAEGSLQGGLREVSRQIREDGELDAEGALEQALGWGLGGAALGAAGNLLGEGFNAGAERLTRARGAVSKEARTAAARHGEARAASDVVPAARRGETGTASFERKSAERGWQGEVRGIEGDFKSLKRAAKDATERRSSWNQIDDELLVSNIDNAADIMDDAANALRDVGPASSRAQKERFIEAMDNAQHLARGLDAAGFSSRVPKMFRRQAYEARMDLMLSNGIKEPSLRKAIELTDDQLDDAVLSWLVRDPARKGTDLAGFAKRTGWDVAKEKIKESVLKKLGMPAAAAFLGAGGAAEGAIASAIGLASKGAALGGIGKAASVAFKDPSLGGALVAGTAAALSTAPLFIGDKPSERSTDPRRAARDFAKRVRSTDPGKVASSAAGAGDGSQAGSFISIMQRRFERMREIVDREVPRPGPAGELLDVRLPSRAAADKIAEHLRVSTSPRHFLDLLAAGRLTPELLETAQRVFPRSVAAAKLWVMSVLAQRGGSEGLPPRVRRAFEMLMRGAETDVDVQRAGYISTMQESAARSAAAAPGRPPTATTKVSDLFETRTGRASGK